MAGKRAGAQAKAAQSRIVAERAGGPKGGRPGKVGDKKLLDKMRILAGVGLSASDVSKALGLHYKTVAHWLNMGDAGLEQGDWEENPYVKFRNLWYEAKITGRAAVLGRMMESENSTVVDKWLTRTDDSMEYLDKDKQYDAEHRHPVIEVNQDNRSLNLAGGLEAVKERMRLERAAQESKELSDGQMQVHELSERQIIWEGAEGEELERVYREQSSNAGEE